MLRILVYSIFIFWALGAVNALFVFRRYGSGVKDLVITLIIVPLIWPYVLFLHVRR